MFFKTEPTLERTSAKEIELTRKRATLTDALARAEAKAGESYLNDEGIDGDHAGEVLRLQVEIAALGRAINSVRSLRRDAIRGAFKRESEELLKQANAKQQELTRLEAKVESVLAELSTLEGAAYAPTGTPRSSILRDEIGNLIRQANELKDNPIPDCGLVDLESVVDSGAVIGAVLSCRANGPSVEQVSAWLDACELAAVKHRNSSFGAFPRRVRLEWGPSGINLSSSYVSVAALMNKLKASPAFASARDSSDGNGYFDVGSGTFRADRAPDMKSLASQYNAPVHDSGDFWPHLEGDARLPVTSCNCSACQNIRNGFAPMVVAG